MVTDVSAHVVATGNPPICHCCTEPQGGVEGGSAYLLPCWSFRVDGGAAEMVQGDFGTPCTYKLISVVPWSPWLCTNFPLFLNETLSSDLDFKMIGISLT